MFALKNKVSHSIYKRNLFYGLIIYYFYMVSGGAGLRGFLGLEQFFLSSFPIHGEPPFPILRAIATMQ